MSQHYESIKELEEFTRKMPFPWLQMQSNAKHGVATIKKGHVNMQWSTPASWVSGPTWMEGLALRIDALKYAEDAIALDGVKYAPFSINLRQISSSTTSIHLFSGLPSLLSFTQPLVGAKNQFP